MITLKAYFEDGNEITTRINATLEEAKRYYEGNYFNLGPVEDDMKKCIQVEEVE